MASAYATIASLYHQYDGTNSAFIQDVIESQVAGRFHAWIAFTTDGGKIVAEWTWAWPEEPNNLQTQELELPEGGWIGAWNLDVVSGEDFQEKYVKVAPPPAP